MHHSFQHKKTQTSIKKQLNIEEKVGTAVKKSYQTRVVVMDN